MANNDTKPEKDPRMQQIEDRKKRLKELNPALPRVRVNPRDDALRKALRHPSGSKFPATGSAEWPLDQFTRRRIADGSVTREDAEQPEQEQPTQAEQGAQAQTQRQGPRSRAAPQQPGPGQSGSTPPPAPPTSTQG